VVVAFSSDLPKLCGHCLNLLGSAVNMMEDNIAFLPYRDTAFVFVRFSTMADK